MESLSGGSLFLSEKLKTPSIKITSVYNLHEMIEAIRLILKEKIMKLQNGDLHDTMRGIV